MTSGPMAWCDLREWRRGARTRRPAVGASMAECAAEVCVPHGILRPGRDLRRQRLGSQRRNRRQQRLGIRMHGVVEQSVADGRLNYSTAEDYQHAMAEMSYHGKVVADEKHRHTGIAL